MLLAAFFLKGFRCRHKKRNLANQFFFLLFAEQNLDFSKMIPFGILLQMYFVGCGNHIFKVFLVFKRLYDFF